MLEYMNFDNIDWALHILLPAMVFLMLLALIYSVGLFLTHSSNHQMGHARFNRIRVGSAILAALLAIGSLIFVVYYPKDSLALAVFAVWSIAAPSYFFAEFWFVNLDNVKIEHRTKQNVLDELKTYTDYLRNVWAGYIATLGAIILSSP